MKKIWEDSEITYMFDNFPNMPTQEVANQLGRSYGSVSSMASILGLKKSEEFHNSAASGRMKKGDRRGISTQFKKGGVPHNKGKSMSREMYEKCKKTMFKKGIVPHNTKHNGEPYLYTRVRDNGKEEKIWFIQELGSCKRLPYARYLCEKEGIDLTGKVARLKPGHDVNKVPTLDDIDIISFEENMKLNSLHNYPEELVKLIQLKGFLNRQINKLNKNKDE